MGTMETYSLWPSCFCHIRLASLRSPSSFLYTSLSVSFNRLPRNVGRRKISINIFHEEEDSADVCNFFRRKSPMLLRSSSLIPAFKLNSRPPQGLTSADHMQKVKQMLVYGASSYSFLSILAGLGILACIAFSVLHAFAGKLRNANRVIIESMQTDLDEVYASLVSMEMDFKLKMLDEKEEDNKKMLRIQEEKLYLIEKIRMGKQIVANLERELMKEKELADDLTLQFLSARSYAFEEAHQEKKELQGKLCKETYYTEEHNNSILQLGSKIEDKMKSISAIQLLLPQKKIELVEMNTSICDILTELNCFHHEVKIQKDQKLLRRNSELKTAKASSTNLIAQIISLSSERDNATSQANDLHNRFKDLESICNVKQAARSELLSALNCEILHLKEHIKLASSELSHQFLESDLIQERDELKRLIKRESGISRNLQSRRQIMEETVKESREVALHTVSQLQQSENSCSKLMSKLLYTRIEFADSKNSLEKKLNEMNLHSEVTKASINKTSELANLHDKVKNLGWTLKEEKDHANILSLEIVELKRRIAEEKKPREKLEKQLAVTNKSTDEMKRNMLLLSEEIGIVYSRIDGLRNELKAIVSLIEKERHSTNELIEEMEYANGIVDRLGEDGKELKKECRKLEKELALAKGEILVERS